MSTPGVVFAVQFITADSANAAKLLYSGHALGYLGRAEAYLNQKEEIKEALEQTEAQSYSGHALGYLGREKATDLFKASVMEQGHKIYFGSPGEGVEEHSAGVFTAMQDSLTEQEQSAMQNRFDVSQGKGCPLYTTVISFDDPFLAKYGIDYHSAAGQKALKEYTRLGVANLIRYSQLDERNTVWTAAIHYNTDNIHIHVDLVEKEKMEREKDMLPVIAFDKLKSAVMNKIIDNRYSVELDDVIRKNLLQGIKEKPYDPEILTDLLRKLPRNVPWEYNRQGMKPYQPLIRKSVDAVVKGSPKLTASWQRLNKELGEYETFLRDLYGEGKRDLAKQGAANKLHDFYVRAGNAVLQAADALRPDFEEKEKLRIESETPAENAADIPLKEAPAFPEPGRKSAGERTEREKDEDVSEPEEPKRPDSKSEDQLRYTILEQQVLNGDINAYYRLGCLMRAGTVNAPNPDAAVMLFTYAATKGHAAAAYQLGKIHTEDRQKKDPALARYWFERAADAGHDGAMYQLGKLHEKTDAGMAEMWYRKAAEQQNAFAALRLAELYKNGTLDDDAQLGDQYQRWAFLLLKRKGERSENSDFVHYQLGRMYRQGLGTERDYPEAVYQFMTARDYPPAMLDAIRMSNDKAVLQELTAAAENGDERARLASLLLDSCRTSAKPYAAFTDQYRAALKQLREQKCDVAIPLLRTEAQTGNVYAAAELGRVYRRGLGVDADEEKSDAYYKQAYEGLIAVNSKKPDAYLQYRIGKLVQRGLGTEADEKKALEWFLKSAGQGNRFAQLSAGDCYYSGTGCEQDYRQAAEWFERAADQDNAFALYKLGVMSEQGQGMDTDDKKAYAYYARAFSLFRAQAEETKDEQLQYRLGRMALDGKERNRTLPWPWSILKNPSCRETRMQNPRWQSCIWPAATAWKRTSAGRCPCSRSWQKKTTGRSTRLDVCICRERTPGRTSTKPSITSAWPPTGGINLRSMLSAGCTWPEPTSASIRSRAPGICRPPPIRKIRLRSMLWEYTIYAAGKARMGSSCWLRRPHRGMNLRNGRSVACRNSAAGSRKRNCSMLSAATGTTRRRSGR